MECIKKIREVLELPTTPKEIRDEAIRQLDSVELAFSMAYLRKEQLSYLEEQINPHVSMTDGIDEKNYLTGEQWEEAQDLLSCLDCEVIFIPLNVTNAGSNGIMVTADNAHEICYNMWQYDLNSGENEPYEEYEESFFQYTGNHLVSKPDPKK
tara:strand:+ start:541 stop:999 length:459 start_codon:yes stop_codon:yes gene_type:complete